MTRLFRTLILRDLAAQRTRAITTLLGIALGVAVVLAIQLASAGAVRGFERAVEAVAGRASLEITGATGRIDETVLPDLLWLQDVGDVTPIIEGEAIWTAPDGSPSLLRVLGIDILTDRAFREYAFAETDGSRAETTSQVLGILTDPQAVVLTARFAGAHGIEVGDRIRLEMGSGVQELQVRGLLADTGPARALDGELVLMDIAAAQLALDRLGSIDRLEVRLPEGTDVGAAEQAAAARLGDRFRVQRPARRGAQVETMIAAFHANLTALSSVALIVGVFLIYNTVSASVVTRREEIGILRAVGTPRRTIFALFIGEALALALPGILLGLLLARGLAEGAVALTSATVTRLYIAAAAAPPSLEVRHVVLTLAGGLVLAALAAAAPAREAARIAPTAAIRTGREGPRVRLRVRGGIAIACLAAAAWLCTVDPIGGLPLAGYLAAFLIVAGMAALTAPLLSAAAALLDRGFRRFFVLECWLATGNLKAYTGRLAISVAALAVSLAMTVAIAIMVASFRDTVVYWLGQTLVADLFVSPASRRAGSQESTIPEQVEAAVRQHPAVAAVDSLRTMDLPYGDASILLASGEFDVLLEHGRLLFKAPADGERAVREARGEDAVVVSESFALRYGKDVGDVIELQTREGPRPFRIAGIHYDYSNDRGTVVMDRSLFVRYFDDRRPTSLAVYLQAGTDADRVRDEIAAAAASGPRMAIRTNRTLREEVLRIFDSTFAITWALEVIAVTVAVMGIVATLVTVIVERRRELSLLRLVGAARAQVQRMVIAEAAMLGAISQAMGIVAGLALSLVLIYVINVQSFGWSIQFHFPAAFLLQLTVVLIAATAVAGIPPARRAAGTFLTERAHDE